MIGPDKRDGSLEKTRATAERLGVAERLEIVGGVAKRAVAGALSVGDIFLNTARVDNAPVSVLEALACGLCVVSTDVGGLRDLISPGEDGLLVPAGDEQAMASAVYRILVEPGLADRLSKGGRSLAESFDWSRVLPQWQRLLSRAVNVIG